MSEERKDPAGEPEAAFFDAERPPDGAPPVAPPAPTSAPPRRRWGAPLLRRSPVFSFVILAVAAWLLGSFWPDVAYFFSAREPIDLGGPGAYHLDRAQENRLVQARGDLVDAVAVRDARSGAERTVGRLAGTNLLVDRPGRGGPPVFEGRLLPVAARDPYGEAARLIADRGVSLGEGWRVLRDGDRPRRGWLPVLGAAMLAALIVLNAWSLLRNAVTRREASR